LIRWFLPAWWLVDSVVGLPDLGVGLGLTAWCLVDSVVGLDLGVVVVNGGALDSVVGLADLGLIFCVPVIFCRSLFFSLPAWWWLTA
jgi:hypothetical protein